MAAITENNPQILYVVQIVQQRCREAIASNGAGKIRFTDLDYFTGNLGRWIEPSVAPSIDLTKVGAKP